MQTREDLHVTAVLPDAVDEGNVRLPAVQVAGPEQRVGDEEGLDSLALVGLLDVAESVKGPRRLGLERVVEEFQRLDFTGCLRVGEFRENGRVHEYLCR